jgi:hypothetical protein
VKTGSFRKPAPQAPRRQITSPRVAVVVAAGLLWAALGSSGAIADDRRNPFNDPMLQLTNGMPECPVPEVPIYTGQEFLALAHERSQRGVSCWLAGRCRLSNAYLYDAEIIPRVKIAVHDTARHEKTSVWALGQRRRVWLRGCVQSLAQSKDIEAIVRHLDDVEDVQNEMMIGVHGKPPYRVHAP